MRYFKAAIYFEPRDIWIGVYWDRQSSMLLNVYVCLLPMLPIRLQFLKKVAR